MPSSAKAIQSTVCRPGRGKLGRNLRKLRLKMTSFTKIRLKIRRQASKDAPANWETFEIPFREKLNVISALMEIRKDPRTVDGASVKPPAWETACLEEVCGSCTMNVNGMIRQACTPLMENVGEANGDVLEVTHEPMKKFPVVRELIVDRSQMFDNLK